MTDYLDGWNVANRREAYYDSHKRKNSFLGYWSWEAAAVTFLLDIDDHAYKNSKLHLADLVDFARGLNFFKSNFSESYERKHELSRVRPVQRMKFGEKLDISLQQWTFAIGEIMQADDASYSITI